MTKKLVLAAAFLGCILAANYVTTRYGMVPVWFGLIATAGTYFAGLSFVIRDSLQDAIRRSLPPRQVTVYEQLPGIGAGYRTRVQTVPPSDLQVSVRVVAVVALGAALSFLVADPFIAAASAAAFGISELVDLGIYTPLRRRGYVRAAVASNIAGAFVDTVVFLAIAGFPVMAALPGQMVGKVAVTVLAVALVASVRGYRKVATA